MKIGKCQNINGNYVQTFSFSQYIVMVKWINHKVWLSLGQRKQIIRVNQVRNVLCCDIVQLQYCDPTISVLNFKFLCPVTFPQRSIFSWFHGVITHKIVSYAQICWFTVTQKQKSYKLISNPRPSSTTSFL